MISQDLLLLAMSVKKFFFLVSDDEKLYWFNRDLVTKITIGDNILIECASEKHLQVYHREIILGESIPTAFPIRSRIPVFHSTHMTTYGTRAIDSYENILDEITFEGDEKHKINLTTVNNIIKEWIRFDNCAINPGYVTTMIPSNDAVHIVFGTLGHEITLIVPKKSFHMKRL